MQIELSQQTAKKLRELSVDGTTPDSLVELAIDALIDSLNAAVRTDEYFDTTTAGSFGSEGLRQKLAESEAAMTAGEFSTLAGRDDRRAFFAEIKRQGRADQTTDRT